GRACGGRRRRTAESSNSDGEHRTPKHTTRQQTRSPSTSPRSPRPPARLVGSLRGDQLPVRIARVDLARKSPDVGDLLDALGVTADHLAAPVARGRDELTNKLNRDLRSPVLELGLHHIGGLDADEALVDLLAAALAIADGPGEPFE